MPTAPSPPPKPVSEIWRPDLVALPRHTFWRRTFRALIRRIFRLVLWCLTRPRVRGLENFPERGPVIIVINHLGDADAALAAAYFPRLPDALAKIEMYDFPIVGKLMHAYGVIWLHRGQPDLRALRAALDGLDQGRVIAIAPEGRYSLIRGLEEGAGGAAYLALKAKVPILPVAVTGTENAHVYGSLRRLRRAPVSLTFGETFYLDPHPDRHEAVRLGTEQVMSALADLLPPEYRGVYRDE
jgi:1-acyl-sn-glycerol-3-phosphate acyltransferase